MPHESVNGMTDDGTNLMMMKAMIRTKSDVVRGP